MAYSPSTGGLTAGDLPPGAMAPQEVVQKLQPPAKPVEEGFDFLLKLAKRLEKEDEETDRAFYRKWIKVAKTYEGEHLGRFDAQGRWRSYQPQIGDPFFIHPEFRFHSDSITAAWTQSRPDIRVLPASDDDRTVSAARKAEQVIDHYEDTILTEEFLQREGKFGQFTGQMYRYTCWDSNLGPEVPRYEFEEEEQELEGPGLACSVCGAEYRGIDTEGIEVCPDCGGEVMPVPPTTLKVPVPKEAGKYHIGDISTECVPAFQIKVDRSQGVFEKANFIRRRRLVRAEVIKEMFPFWEPPQRGFGSDDFGLRAEDALRSSSGSGSRGWRSDRPSFTGVIVNQWWLAPCLYAHRGPETKDLKFAGGETIPAGTRLIEAYPTGIYLLIIDDKILDLREEYLHDHWQHSPFISVPTRVEGDGIEDLLEPQRQLNDLMSLVYIDAKANACPPTIVNTSFGLKTEQIMGKPHYVIPARVPTGESIDNAIWQGGGKGTPFSLFKFIDMLRGESQLLAKSFSAATGAPDVVTDGKSMTTATGTQLAASAAQGQRAPELAIRAHGTMIWAKQVLKLFQKNAIDAHYIPKQGRYGILEGQNFKGADIEADFIFTVRNRSWVPRDEFSRRNDLIGAIQAGLFDPMLPRGVREEIAEIFNVNITITSDVADQRIARMRVEQMKELLPQLQQEIGDPQAITLLLQEAVPIDIVVDNHMLMQEWYIDLLKTDEGITFPPELRQALTQRIVAHQQAGAMQMQQQMALQVMAQAPMIGMQQAQQDEQQASQAEEGDKQRKHDMEKTKLQARSRKPQPKPKGK